MENIGAARDLRPPVACCVLRSHGDRHRPGLLADHPVQEVKGVTCRFHAHTPDRPGRMGRVLYCGTLPVSIRRPIAQEPSFVARFFKFAGRAGCALVLTFVSRSQTAHDPACALDSLGDRALTLKEGWPERPSLL